MARGHLVDAVEAAYRDKTDTTTWLTELGEAARGYLGDDDVGGNDLGLIAYTYRITSLGTVAIDQAVAIDPVLDDPDGLDKVSRQLLAMLPPDYVRETFARTPCALATRVGSAATQALTREQMPLLFGDRGWRELFVINGIDPSGGGIYVGVPFSKTPHLRKRAIESWTRVAAHAAAAYRLRRASVADDPWAGAEAIFESGGAFHHAEQAVHGTDARDQLRAAATAIDRSRTKQGRQNEHESVELWPALVAGRWSVIDRVDTDGRRLFIARKNDPEVHRHFALTTREHQVVAFAALGHPNKLIGYELGLTTGAVGSYLSVACEKLGVRSRSELLQLVSAFGGATPPR